MTNFMKITYKTTNEKANLQITRGTKKVLIVYAIYYNAQLSHQVSSIPRKPAPAR